MSYKIAIASGKGGTGKTTVSVNLFNFFNKLTETKVQLVDCDVEEPNDMLFFPACKKTSDTQINQAVPTIDVSKCSFCRKCVDYCAFNAIVVIPPARFAAVNPNLCHSCGACLVACTEDAITEHPIEIGRVIKYQHASGNHLTEGKLKIGSAMQTMLIRELKKSLNTSSDILIFDAPPGTSCPVIETISDANYIILVTEPTPFGLYDLKLMVDLVEQLKIPYGIVVNKSDLGDNEIYAYMNSKKISILGKIPFSKTYASQYAKGNLTDAIPIEIATSYHSIIDFLKNKIDCFYERDNTIKW